MAEVHETVPPRGDYFSYVTRVLDYAFRIASYIKSSVYRESAGDDFFYVTRGRDSAFQIASYIKSIAIGAIRSARQKLQLYSKVPPNGLLIYKGIVVTAAGEKKEVSINFEASLRLLNNKFHGDNYENDRNIAISKIKLLIKLLKDAKGKEKTLISLVMAPWEEISEVTKILDDRAGKPIYKHAKGAITSAKRILEQYNKVPAFGLVIYTGTVVTDDGREKDVTIIFEPLKIIWLSTRLIIDRFDIKDLTRLLEPESEPRYGFIVMDMVDNRALFGILSGNRKEVINEFTAQRRLDPRLRKELVYRAAESYIQCNSDVSAFVVAVCPAYQPYLTGWLDRYLDNNIIMCMVEVSYGGKLGFDEAIALSSNHLCNVRYFQEICLLKKFMKEMVQETNKCVFGVAKTLKCLDMGAVDILIVWENLDITSELITKHLNSEFGFRLEFVTDSSREGSQFCRAFCGIGGILKYQVDIQAFDNLSDAGDQPDIQSSDDNSDDGDQLDIGSFYLSDDGED